MTAEQEAELLEKIENIHTVFTIFGVWEMASEERVAFMNKYIFGNKK